jgi:hypothetical protein
VFVRLSTKESGMEDLWRIGDMGYRLNNPADRAEYDKLRKRFREEEEALNVRNLLYGDSRLERELPKKDSPD